MPDSISEESLIPSPEELVDELVEHEKHPKKRKHRILGTLVSITFYLAATYGLGYAGYLGYQKAQIFWVEHKALEAKLAEKEIAEKATRDVERTLQLAYDHLTPWEARYYAIIFTDFSKKYGIPWEAYAALVRYESNFNPTLKSDSGAVGMSQVMEPTGKATAIKLGIKYRDDETLWNDLLNMVIGLTYFSEGYQAAIQEGQTKAESLQHAMRRYVSGTGSIAKIKKKKMETQKYVGEYKTSLWQEFKKLMMFYKGVEAGDPDSVLLELQ